MENLKTEEIKVQIKKRKEIIKEISIFVENITCEVGKEIFRSESSSSTHIKTVLEDFKGFSFLFDAGQSMMGGEEVYVWEGVDREKPPVFRVHNQNGEYTVKEFKKDTNWLEELLKIIKNKNNLLTEIKREKKDQKSQQLLQRKKQKERSQLLKVAERLKL